MSDERTFTAQQLRTAQRPTLETPEQHPSQLLQDQRIARKRRRAEESPDQQERRLVASLTSIVNRIQSPCFINSSLMYFHLSVVCFVITQSK